ncbi:UPF0167 protein Rv2295 [Rubritalea halochordaticola]|uniref:UPF0167 protein Rv2295 n=1 Tax=Rubritalea halochordaticola TaxID=714537 RepID=A0ABP9V073_9BACT
MLPTFKYHPNPIETGAIKESDAICECCSEGRGYIYTASIYSSEEVEAICPWCIADGSAAEKFDGSFSDDYPLIDDGIAPEIIDVVTKRTPGFSSWQQEVWLSCCNDACEFHGDASISDVKEMTLDVFQAAFEDRSLTVDFLSEFKRHYAPGGNPAIYKWICGQCGSVRYYADFT